MTTKITIYNVYDDHGVHNMCYVQNGKPPTNDRCYSIYMYRCFIYIVFGIKKTSCSTNRLGVPLCPIGLSTVGINKKLYTFIIIRNLTTYLRTS